MTQLLDLDDDCLLEVLDRLPADQLFKMLRVNSRLRRLAGDKMRVKVKAVAATANAFKLRLIESRPLFADHCAHLGSIARDQELILGKIINCEYYLEKALLSLLPRLSGLKAIDLDREEVNGQTLNEIAVNCPDVECLKFGWLWFVDHDWQQFLDRVGEKIVHFTKHWHDETKKRLNLIYLEDLLAMLVEKCVNIKRLDWLEFDRTASFSMVNKLSKSCWVNLRCWDFDENVYEDVVDKLSIQELNWSMLGRCVDRLSKLVILELKPVDEDLVGGVNFAGLKTLDFRKRFNCQFLNRYNSQLVNCFIASRFPRLEEFGFNIIGGLTEDDFDALFQRMASVKKISIFCAESRTDETPKLPEAAIHHLKDLEFIIFEINSLPKKWQPEEFLQHLEKYILEIKSMKKLTVDMKCFDRPEEWRKKVEDAIKLIKMKQNRVEVDLVKRIELY